MLRGESRRARPWGTCRAQACCGGGCRRKDHTRRRAPHHNTPVAPRAILPLPRPDRRRPRGQAQPMRLAHHGIFRKPHDAANFRAAIPARPKAAQQINLFLMPFFTHHARRAFRARAFAQSDRSSSA